MTFAMRHTQNVLKTCIANGNLDKWEVIQVSKGQSVTVKLYGGKTAKRRVVAVKGDVIVICSEEEYQAAEREGRDPSGLGFPVQDVIDSRQFAT
jgi:hypothetical protein